MCGGDGMTMTEWFLAELESEAAKSRRVLEQVPTGKPSRWTSWMSRRKALDKAIAQAREALQKTTDAHLEIPWRLLASGQLAFEQPRH
jgi:hypothetical protein